MSTNTRSDLTLLQLEEEVYLSETVLPACLSTNPVLETQSLNEGDLAQFIGFGQSNQEATLHAENLILRPCLKSTPKRNVNFCAASSGKYFVLLYVLKWFSSVANSNLIFNS